MNKSLDITDISNFRQTLVDHVPGAIAMFDKDMCYLACSQRWLLDYGLDDLPLIGKSHCDIFPDIPERWREVHRRGLTGEVIEATEDHFDRQDGSVQWLHWIVRPGLMDRKKLAGS